MTARLALALATALCLALATARGAVAGTPGLQTAVVFTQGEPRANASELIRRLSTPLGEEAVRATLARTGKALKEQPLDLSLERFTVYVPPGPPPPGGYGVLVFVPPWEDARLPATWTPVLDMAGVIFVSAARSGNDASVLGRREPLALIAAANIAAGYPVNPARVFVGGFSGGSRVAMRLAVAYPDIFAGALLDAGIVTNRNSIPADPNGAWYTSGIRFGTPALTTRGFGAAEFDRVAEMVVEVLTNTSAEGASKAKYTLTDATADWVRAASAELLDANPLYPGLTL